MTESKYMSISEAANTLGITYVGLQKWLKEGRIEHLEIPSGKRITWLIDRGDFNRFLEENRVRATPKRPAGRPSIVKIGAMR